jgi:predicted DNA-binding transcriptional regulator YafY
VRADRLIALALLLQARGRMTAAALAAELEVSVRTVYRDLTALSAAGIPVVTESGPNGGCWLIDGYRFPLRGLSPAEAEALLILGVPAVLAELGLAGIASAAQDKIARTVPAALPSAALPSVALIHLDMPAWFRASGSAEEVPCLWTVASAVRNGRGLEIRYRGQPRVTWPLGLVNKAGTWYLVALTDGKEEPATFRVGRISAARELAEPVARPAGFELAAYWTAWSAAFEASRPRIEVRLRASPDALRAFPEVFGDGVRDALAAAGPPDPNGWREVTLAFEHHVAAGHKLAGFGGQVRVLSPAPVRDWILATAREILALY